jgi:hypothetical protein
MRSEDELVSLMNDPCIAMGRRLEHYHASGREAYDLPCRSVVDGRFHVWTVSSIGFGAEDYLAKHLNRYRSEIIWVSSRKNYDCDI